MTSAPAVKFAAYFDTKYAFLDVLPSTFLTYPDRSSVTSDHPNGSTARIGSRKKNAVDGKEHHVCPQPVVEQRVARDHQILIAVLPVIGIELPVIMDRHHAVDSNDAKHQGHGRQHLFIP